MSDSAPTRSMLAALTSALLASLCCGGPLIAAALGLGGVSTMFSSLEPLRPVFAAAALGLLVHAFLRAYRRDRLASHSAVGHGPARRGILWGGALLCTGLLALGLPVASSALAQATAPGPSSASVGDSQVVLTVEGADCASCLVGVRGALQKLPGVSALDGGEKANQLRVRYRPGQIDAAAIHKVAQAKSELKVSIAGSR